jgi:hypothetical protein
VKPFKHVKVVKVDLEREFYTKHGQHLKNNGKGKISVKIALVEPIRRIREARLQEKRRYSYKILKQQH